MTNLEVIKKALECVHLNPKVVELSKSDLPEVDDDLKDFEGYTINGIYLYKDLREVSTVLETYKVPHWIVGYDFLIPGGHWEPDDYDFIIHSEYRSFQDSIIEVINVLNKQALENMFEYLSYQE